MARWKESVVKATAPRATARERMRLISELLSLPASEHDVFLKQFYAAHEGWPFAETTCRCVRCITI